MGTTIWSQRYYICIVIWWKLNLEPQTFYLGRQAFPAKQALSSSTIPKHMKVSFHISAGSATGCPLKGSNLCNPLRSGEASLALDRTTVQLPSELDQLCGLDTTIFSVSFLVDMWAEPASFAFTCSLDPIKKLGSFLIEKVCSVIKISFPLIRFFTLSPNFQILLVVVPIRIGTKLASSV